MSIDVPACKINRNYKAEYLIVACYVIAIISASILLKFSAIPWLICVVPQIAMCIISNNMQKRRDTFLFPTGATLVSIFILCACMVAPHVQVNKIQQSNVEYFALAVYIFSSIQTWIHYINYTWGTCFIDGDGVSVRTVKTLFRKKVFGIDSNFSLVTTPYFQTYLWAIVDGKRIMVCLVDYINDDAKANLTTITR